MRLVAAAFVVAALLASAAAGGARASAAGGGAKGAGGKPDTAATGSNKNKDQSDHKVILCHATSSASNPYVIIEVDTSAVDNKFDEIVNGHGTHVGEPFNATVHRSGDKWGDIIPPITDANGTVLYAGLNHDTGSGPEFLRRTCRRAPKPRDEESSDDGTDSEDDDDDCFGRCIDTNVKIGGSGSGSGSASGASSGGASSGGSSDDGEDADDRRRKRAPSARSQQVRNECQAKADRKAKVACLAGKIIAKLNKGKSDREVVRSNGVCVAVKQGDNGVANVEACVEKPAGDDAAAPAGSGGGGGDGSAAGAGTPANAADELDVLPLYETPTQLLSAIVADNSAGVALSLTNAQPTGAAGAAAAPQLAATVLAAAAAIVVAAAALA